MSALQLVRGERVTVDPTADQVVDSSKRAHTHQTHGALADVKSHLRTSAEKLVGFLVVAYLVLSLIPTLNQALTSLKRVSWVWVVGAIALEVVSETGFVVSWRRIVDPDKVLQRDGRGWRMDQRVAWAQLGGGLLVPGGSLGGMGVGGWILHRFGMPTKTIAERQFNLSFLNTGVSALALMVFGVGPATGVFAGEDRQAKHTKIARTITTLADAVEDTEHVLVHRSGLTTALGAVAYLGFEILILWLALIAVHTHPTPGFAIVVMAYIIGALGGSLPLPASVGTIGGIAGMLIVYVIIRRQLGPVPIGAHHGLG